MKLNNVAFPFSQKPPKYFPVLFVSGVSFPVFISTSFMSDRITNDLIFLSPDDKVSWIFLDNFFLYSAEFSKFDISKSNCFEVVVNVKGLVVSLEPFRSQPTSNFISSSFSQLMLNDFQ